MPFATVSAGKSQEVAVKTGTTCTCWVDPVDLYFGVADICIALISDPIGNAPSKSSVTIEHKADKRSG